MPYFYLRREYSMATKKAAASARKTTKKPASSAKKVTKVTTVKASTASAATRTKSTRFKLSRAPLLAGSVAEFIGTFLLAAIVVITSGQPLFIMFALLAILLVVGGVSGGHFNPAITIGALATRRITLARAGAYIGAQVLGALLALVVLNGFISAAPETSQQAAAYGQNSPVLFTPQAIAKGKEWIVLAAELLGTVILTFGVANAWRKRSEVTRAAAVAGSLYVALFIASTAASYVGTSAILNPAVAASLQVFKSVELWQIMVYAVTPLVGGVLGFALSDLIRSEDDSAE